MVVLGLFSLNEMNLFIKKEQKVQGLKDHVAVEDWNFFYFYNIFMLEGLPAL